MERPFASRGAAEKARSPGSPEARAAGQRHFRPDALFETPRGGSKHDFLEAPGLIPVADAELAVIETYLGQVLDDLLGLDSDRSRPT